MHQKKFQFDYNLVVNNKTIREQKCLFKYPHKKYMWENKTLSEKYLKITKINIPSMKKIKIFFKENMLILMSCEFKYLY